MKLSQKTIAILIIGAILLSYTTALITVSVIRPDIDITVMSDIHMMCEDQIKDVGSASFIQFDMDNQNMIKISEAIIKTAIDNFIKSRSKILIITGDLTDNGARMSHLAVAKELKRAEDAGKSVYVMPGNHDIMSEAFALGGNEIERTANVSKREFEEIYADFGYSEAYSRDKDTLSYTVNLAKKYRLIAIDSAYYVENPELGYAEYDYSKKPNMTDALLEWCVNEIKRAAEDNMIPIAMTHFPLLPHMGEAVGGFSLSENAGIKESGKVAEAFLNAGLQYIFTGHMHTQDIASYQIEDKALYDIETAALVSYPCPVRNVKFKDSKAEVSTHYVDKLNEKYLPKYLKAEEKARIIKDFRKYTSDYMIEDYLLNFMDTLNEETVRGILNSLVQTDDAANIDELADDVRNNLILKFLNKPLYNQNSMENISVEQICALYGISVPCVQGETVMGLILSVLKSHFNGDEYYAEDSDTLKMLKYCVFTLFYTIDDYDLFGKLHEIDANVKTVDLSSSLMKLFTEEKCELIENNLISAALSFDVITKALPFKVGGNASAVLHIAKSYLDGTEILGINFSPYLDAEGGCLLLGGLIDEVVFTQLGEGLLRDQGPADNNVRLYPDGSWKIKK